jgi:hypothetical protein
MKEVIELFSLFILYIKSCYLILIFIKSIYMEHVFISLLYYLELNLFHKILNIQYFQIKSINLNNMNIFLRISNVWIFIF